jgi:hypothetical protein
MFGFDIDYHFTPQWSVVALLGFNHFRGKEVVERNFHWWNLSLNWKFEFNTNPLRPYINAGGGIYIPKTGSVEPGVNVGAGFDFSVKPGLIIEWGANFHNIFTGGSGTRFYAFHAGVIFRF